MWNALKTKMFRAFGARVGKREFLRLASERGFLTPEQVKEAEELLNCNSNQTSQDLLVGSGFLTQTQAEVVALAVKEEAPTEHRAELFKNADKAVADTGAVHLSAVAAAIARKK